MEPDTQLELFRLPEDQAGSRGRLSPIGYVRIRQDYAVLFVIGGLIGVSVVFAFGVERGKLLVKGEQALSSQPPKVTLNTTPVAPSTNLRPTSAAEVTIARPQEKAPAGSQQQAATDMPKPAKKAAPKPAQFAIQVVSYRQAQLAQKELERLKQRGESAFMLRQQGKATLLVGPFATKQTASEKLLSLRALYQDCFLKNL